MYIRVSWGRLKPGTWDDYERTYTEAVQGGHRGEGLRGRLLARDVDDPDAGYTISFWDDEQSMRNHEQSPQLAELVEQLEPYFSGEYTQRRCEIRLDDMERSA